MSRRALFIVVSLVLFLGCGTALANNPDTEQDRELKIKAAFLYNFLNFIEWPSGKLSVNDESIIIGVIGDENFLNAFDPIKDKIIGGKKLVIKFFKEKDQESYEALKQCHAVILCTCDKDSSPDVQTIIKQLHKASVLLVGEQSNFLEYGGHINFVLEDEKVRFEINLQSATEDGLQIRSKLVRLAKRVIQ